MTHDEINHATEILNALKDGKTVCNNAGQNISSVARLDVIYERNAIALSEPMDGLRADNTTKVVRWTADDWREFYKDVIISKRDKFESLIRYWDESGVKVHMTNEYITYEILARDYVRTDGSPCGKVVEE